MAWSVAAKANIVSTLAGVPLAWARMLALEFLVLMPAAIMMEAARLQLVPSHFGPLGKVLLGVLSLTVGAAWLGPGAETWQLRFAAAVLCIPFYFVAVPMEAWVARRPLPRDLAPLATVWSRSANRLSYGMLIGGLLLLALLVGFTGRES